MERRFQATKAVASVVFAAITLTAIQVAATDFESLLRNPRNYDGQRVSVIGIVIGDGPEFELFRTAREARKSVAPSRSLFVVARGDWHRNRPFDLHRVRVTGTVNAKRHGIWGNPCEISLEHIEVLSKAPVTTSAMPTGLFRNERSETVSVRLFTAKSIQGAFDLGPGESVGLPINDGKIQVLNAAGSVVAEDTLGVCRRSKYYDRTYGVFYYRIVRNQVEKVSPADVDYWQWAK